VVWSAPLTLILCLLGAAGSGCLNPQPEPPAELASSAPDAPDGRGGDDAAAGGTTASGGSSDPGTETPPSPEGDGGSSGSAGSGNGAAGDGGFESGAGGAAGGGDSGAGASGAGGGDDDPGTCRPCGEWLRPSEVARAATVERPWCEGAVEALEEVVACIAEPCAACAERFARDQSTTPACLACFQKACPDQVGTCLGTTRR
jgi:hypothetical protein